MYYTLDDAESGGAALVLLSNARYARINAFSRSRSRASTRIVGTRREGREGEGGTGGL